MCLISLLATHQAPSRRFCCADGRHPPATHLKGEDVWDAQLFHHRVEEGLHRRVGLITDRRERDRGGQL